jgi:hypothetical protein
MNNNTIIRVVIFGALAIIGILAIQSYLLISTCRGKGISGKGNHRSAKRSQRV